MIPLLIGDAADARGFALAGVDSYVCTTREQIEERLGEGFVILFSASAARVIADRIASWRRDGTGPPFVVLPSSMEHRLQPVEHPAEAGAP